MSSRDKIQTSSSRAEADSAQHSELPLSEIRILLWDIDGTLMRSTVQGAFKEYFIAAMTKVYGSGGNLENLKVAGMTDTQIMYEALREEGFTPEQIFARKDELLRIFREEMTAVLAKNGEPYEVLPGVREVLEATHRHPRYVNSLLTGNLSVAAEIKLRSVGLWTYFADSPNVFGEISHERKDLAIEAGKIFNRRFGFSFRPEQFIVIGDTPNDIACARAFGARAVAVATGRHHPPEELAGCAPDFLLEDLTETAEVLKIFGKL